MSGGGPRLPIPSSVRKTIQNIKEIARNHADDEVYAMLKECNMDPNETVQKLLQQDTFQEVRRKRDRRRENMNNKEAADSKWRPITQGRGGKGVRGNYVSRHVSNDASGGKISNSEKDNINKSDKDLLHISSETETKELDLLSPLTGMANGSINAKYENTFKKHVSSEARPPGSVTKVGGRLPPVADKKNVVSETSRESGHIPGKLVVPSSVAKLNSSAADPVLVPSLDSCAAAAVGTIKREIGTQQRSGENKHLYQDFLADDVPSSTETVPTDSGEHWIQGKAQTKSPNADRNQVIEASHSGSSSRPSSNYSTRSQQAILSQKAAGPSKEWKPKPVNSNVQSSGQLATLDAPSVVEDPDSLSLLGSGSERSEGTGLKLQKKLENLHVSTEHVIIPHHLHVPEAERGAFSFGSFDVNFAVNAISINDPNDEKSSSLIPELSHAPDETAEEPSLGQDAVITPQERDYQDQELPSNIPDNISTEEANSQSAISPESDYDQTKQDSMSFANPQYSAVQIAPGYSNLGLIPSVVGSQFAVPDNSEPQLHDASRLTNFVVQQPFDFSSTYYAQMYRPGADGDGRFSPFLVSPGAASKYNGNIAVLTQQSGQSPQLENGNPMVLSTGGPAPLATQPTGVLPSSIALTQQPVPVFRQPAGVHISHYPPNYIPINQYFSPFYVPPPPIHHFLSNAAFPQQPPAGSVYPSPVGGTTAVKYSLPQYKSGNNAGNQTHIFPTGYGPYSSTAAGYGLNPAASTGNLTGSEDIGGSQYKDNGGFIAGQQSEGSNVWVPTPGRDPSGLPTSSFYNLPPQGQHMTFAPSQAGHSSFAGLYHPPQSVTPATAHPLLQQPQTVAGAGEMVGPPSGVYQQPQRAQINWGNSY